MRKLLAATLLIAAAPAWAGLSKAETAMTATVEAERERTIALLERLVNENSGTHNHAGVAKVGAMMRAEFDALGFTTVWKPLPETGRAGHLIATHRGKPGRKRLLLIGHLDTVFEPDSPFQRFEQQGDRAVGPGVGDDKGGIVVIVAALRARKAAGTLRDANIEVVLTGDEEDAGSPIPVARADLIAAGKRADVALDFENLSRENGQDMGSIARRSSNDWSLKITAKSGHSSGIFSSYAGDGAAYELARILTAFRTALPEPNLTFNVGVAAVGATADMDASGAKATATGKSNIIPAVAVANGDVRTLTPEQTARVRAKMAAIVARSLPGTAAEFAFEERYPPMAPTAGNRALLARLNDVNADMGLPTMPELDPARRGAGDIAFVAKDVDGLVGLGPAGQGAHAPGESVDLKSLETQAQRAAILMSRLAAERALR
ncbi:MAG: M20/M25/M40 family metallo-hydrolase [Alphaproteobacteria bacterium]|nr:M20/M25/M40 family metallo-hydrolase [Alphaproteobacteria bacterium]